MQDRRIKSGKLELLIDGVHAYILVFADSWCCDNSFGSIQSGNTSKYKKNNSSLQGLVDTQDLQSEQKTRYHVEAKMAPGENPMILSANITRSLGRKTSFAATVKNVFSEPASLSGIRPAQRRNMFILSGNTLSFSPTSCPGAQA